jgi:hypothetical protein
MTQVTASASASGSRTRTATWPPAALLPDPGKLGFRSAAEAAEEDPLERLALSIVGPLVEVEEEVPGRAGLVVVVAEGENHAKPGEVLLARGALVDLPGEGARADPLGRPPALPVADRPAGTDRLAVARLQIGARDLPGKVLGLEPRRHRPIADTTAAGSGLSGRSVGAWAAAPEPTMSRPLQKKHCVEESLTYVAVAGRPWRVDSIGSPLGAEHALT